MKKFKYLSLVLVFLLITLTGCAGKSEDKTLTDNKKLEEVDLVLDWYPNAIHSFIYAAMEKGYYEEEGLKVNIKFPSNPTDPLTLPAAGKATLGIYYQPDIVMARVNEKVPVKSIGAIVHTPLNVIISLKEKNINSPKDLSGKTIGFSGNPLNTEYVKTMVKADGGDPNSVKIIDVGFELLSSMITKKVDATTGGLINHEVPVLKHEGHQINYFSPSDYGVPRYYEEVFVTSDNTLKEKKETLRKFMKASKKGYEFMKKNPDEALKILLNNQQKDSFPLTEAVEKESMNMLLPKMESKEEAFLYQDKKVWEDNIKWLQENGMLKEKVNAEDFFVNLD
ncbi:putative hydroxymethylpyrimidine transport system substrate-binding protein [Clostridium tetanomorphum]|uniref:ABC transporter substrate-binding protein n=1 Tax=Clostridium tetanomorphum TaxID=1553 RepID=UPI00044AB402|nr:ABC transporter substrate-binding protein [Clostridium tetanomorphum]KAJ49678.1 ABC transporter [Clostridium tetanomorphum DSM 665]KAJ49901.1 ABC transporter [Clostridium tetanomorphum DSM 665]MBP1864574.1 putative hydroxymethylpyrimidine transport system substrate-binding protein [Clostridium tetanomorphum]NRS84043.1 putative hydroxymethylpyrimidine transport system substrate-binding protein [Clostridium tetanomorphum]SQB92866.1 ABC transporter [Clostridium tetanomorphum]